MPKVKPIPSRSLTREERIDRYYSPQQAAFINRVLDSDKLDVVDSTEGMDVRDYFPLALTDWMLDSGNERLISKYSHPHYLDPVHQRMSVVAWYNSEQALVKARKESATTGDVIDDFNRNNNGARHAIWYALRFPDKVELNGRK